MTLAIETRNLTKIFRRGTNLIDWLTRRGGKNPWIAALDGVTLSVRQGEIFALLGPNGAGKTTLIKTLSSLIIPDGGEARIYGLDVSREPIKTQSLISLVIQEERSFYWRLTGRQNLEFYAALYGLSEPEARKKIDNAAFQLGLDHLDQRYQEYSTGVKCRLALARSFLNDAKLIFMDEPTRSLDPNAQARVRALIKNHLRLVSGRTLFFTTHLTHEAEELADRIAILDRGKIKACGSLPDLRKAIGNPAASLEEIFRALTLTEADRVF